MIERILLDAQGEALLKLFHHSQAQALLPLEEGLPELMPVGQVQEVAGTGVKIYVGSDQLTSGNYTLTLGTYGRSAADNFNLQRAVMQAAVLTRAIQRNGATLPIVRFAKISRTLHGGAQFSGRVSAEFVPASPYWLADVREVTLMAGQHTVDVGGMARCPLKITVNTSAQAEFIVYFDTDAGRTEWRGASPGGPLVIDARPGRWTVTLNGQDVSLLLNGAQPYLNPGRRTVKLSFPATLEWREGVL